MADAILHDEFTPGGGSGGVCATGEIIIGPRYDYSDSWAPGRFVVVDPAGPTFDVYTATLPGGWNFTNAAGGVPWNGGVAMIASSEVSGTQATYVVVVYPDASYDVFSTGAAWAAAASVAVDASDRLVVVRQAASAAPRVRNADGTWSNLGFSTQAAAAPHIVGGVLWAAHTNLVGTNITTNATVATYSSLFPGNPAQSFVHDGRFWSMGTSTRLQGVRLSDGDVRNLTTPPANMTPLAVGAGKAWVTSPSVTWSIDLTSGSVTTYPHPASLGAIYNVFFTAGAAWAPGRNPTS